MAAPIYQVSPQTGSDPIIVVFAVVVIGGIGSIAGSVANGFGLGLRNGLAKAFYPEASNTVVFVIMALALVLVLRPAGRSAATTNRLRPGAARRAARPTRATTPARGAWSSP